MPDALPASEATDVRVRPSFEVLLTALADAVLAVPGVARLEPTLSTAGPRVLLGHRHTDGLHVLDRSGMADVDVNLATSSDYQARTVAHEVHRTISEVLAAHGYATGSVAVSILAVIPSAD